MTDNGAKKTSGRLSRTPVSPCLLAIERTDRQGRYSLINRLHSTLGRDVRLARRMVLSRAALLRCADEKQL
jgi:hypothetical protein